MNNIGYPRTIRKFITYSCDCMTWRSRDKAFISKIRWYLKNNMLLNNGILPDSHQGRSGGRVPAQQ